MAEADTEILQGDKCVSLFRQLIEKKVIVSMYVEGTKYEQLTLITGLEQTPSGEYLIIDPPSGFASVVKNTDDWKLQFTLNGPDKLEYLFSTRGGTHLDNRIKVPVPDSVQRLQRRKDFRVNTLPKTKLMFVNPDLKGVILLNNISMGGIYGALVKHNRKKAVGPLLEMHQFVHNIAISFPAYGDMENHVVMIKKAIVVRVDRDQKRHEYRYALEFKEMCHDQESILRHIIYKLQRYFLKNR